MERRQTSWAAIALMAWVGLFAFFSLAPSNLCETSLSGISLCVTSQPPIGMTFMPVRRGPQDKILDAAFDASVALAGLAVLVGLYQLVRRKP